VIFINISYNIIEKYKKDNYKDIGIIINNKLLNVIMLMDEFYTLSNNDEDDIDD